DGRDSPDHAVQFCERRIQAGARRFRQARVILLQRQRFRQQAQLFAVPRVQALPQLPLAAAIAPQPALAAQCRLPALRLGCLCSFLRRSNHVWFGGDQMTAISDQEPLLSRAPRNSCILLSDRCYLLSSSRLLITDDPSFIHPTAPSSRR